MATTKVRGELVDLNEATSESGLKMPSGTELNRPTDATGQIRNNTNEASNQSSSAQEYYNGTDWKVINNTPLTINLASPTLLNTKVVTTTQGSIRGWSMTPDGTAFYGPSLNGSTQHYLHKYAASTPYDVSTIGSPTSYQITSPAISNYNSGCIINSNQSIIGYDPYTNIQWYTQPFGTNGDITTLGSASTFSCSRTGGDRTSRSMTFVDNETKWFMISTEVRRFDLSTAGDPGSGPTCPSIIESASAYTTDLDGGNLRCFQLNYDGTQLIAAGDSMRLAVYTLSTPFDVTTRGTATKYNYTTVSGGSTAAIRGVFTNLNYTKLILTCSLDTIFEFSLS